MDTPNHSRPARLEPTAILSALGLLALVAGLAHAAGGIGGSLPLPYLLAILPVGIGIGVYLSKRCTCSNQRKGSNDWNTAEMLLAHLDSCILLLDRQGWILFANPAACKMLHTPAGDLSSRKFQDLCVSDLRPLPEHYGESAHLALPDAPPLPVSCRRADIALPASAIPGLEGKDGIETTLLVFSDLSHPLKLERQLRQVERITAATRIAGEMAHEIRTPLTAISASVQLLKHYEEKATSADWLPNSPRRKDRAELFAHIISASDRMESSIQNFVDFAEFSPTDLLSIIKLDSIDENHGYIGRLSNIAKGFENGQNPDSGRRSDNSKFVEQNTAHQGL